jgi:hypothetical protein
MMSLLQRLFAGKSRWTPTPRARPTVETLEGRQLPSAATLAVASAIENSPEHFADFVSSEFVRFLRRAPDAVGLNFFVTRMEQGMSPEAVEAAFVSSTEYIFDHGNTQVGWLTGLYNDLLGRTPDLAGLNHWLNNLAAGETPFQVAGEFATSVERQTIVIREDYADFLGRAPDTTGLNTWLRLLESGVSRTFVASAILGSTEFFQKSGNSNSSFVIAVFSDVLGRTPSIVELNNFVTELQISGMTPALRSSTPSDGMSGNAAFVATMSGSNEMGALPSLQSHSMPFRKGQEAIQINPADGNFQFEMRELSLPGTR